MKNIYNKLLMALGVLSVVLAIVGTFLPIMPTVPFLLLAAACFSRSSPRFHRALMDHAHFGPLIRDYHAGKGIPKRVKRISLVTLWFGGAFSVAVVPVLWGKLVMAGIFVAVAAYLLALNTSDQEERL